MAWKKPQINVIKPDIKNISIYLRSTKKFGKSTLFRDTILEKYGDPSKGLIVECGNEDGCTMLDNVNCTHINSYKDAIELRDWLINKKGIEHDIEMVAFDTVDELALIFDDETIRQSNLENPQKKAKSIKGAFGGYTAGEKFTANNLIKPYMSSLRRSGFGVWAIAHTKFKTIKEKGGLDEDGYMQLTSNMGADYESAFGDIFDVTLTGVIDRDIEEKGSGDSKKRYSTGTVRKLYFRETPLIDAGGRFAFGAVPEFLVFDKENMAQDFIKIVEDGMKKSKKELQNNNDVKASNPLPKKLEELYENISTDEELEEDLEENIVEEIEEDNENDLRDKIRAAFKTSSPEIKKAIKEVLLEYGTGKLDDCSYEGLLEIKNNILNL